MHQGTEAEVSSSKKDPWLKDGNIVFACAGEPRFRVHSSVMARNSEVFVNMFNDARPGDTSSNECPTVEGCPVINVCDTVDDLQNLLLAFYGQVTFDVSNIDGFMYLSSLLRMATKYVVDWLCKKAIHHLSQSWLVTLESWESLANQPETLLPHPSLIINLVQEVDACMFLPVAYCRLGCLPMKEALMGELHSSTGPIAKSAFSLSIDDVYNYIVYGERRATLIASLANGTLRDREKYCVMTSMNSCNERFGRVIRACLLEAATNHKDSPIHIFNAVASKAAVLEKICEHCNAKITSDLLEQKEAMWGKLPGWFDLPSWEILRDMKSVGSNNP